MKGFVKLPAGDKENVIRVEKISRKGFEFDFRIMIRDDSCQSYEDFWLIDLRKGRFIKLKFKFDVVHLKDGLHPVYIDGRDTEDMLSVIQ